MTVSLSFFRIGLMAVVLGPVGVGRHQGDSGSSSNSSA